MRVLGLLLIVLLPFLVYLLLFALYSAITLACLAVPLLTQGHSAAGPRGALIIGLAIVVVGTLVAIVLGFYNLFFAPRGGSFGIPLAEAEHAGFWRLARETASAAGARAVDDVVVSPFPGIGVYMAGNLIAALFGRGRQVLVVGVPSIYRMTAAEFQAILAHEYAHFSHHDTQWGELSAAMESAIVRAFKATPGPRHTASGILSKLGGWGELVRLVVWLNPAYWTLRVYLDLFFRTTGGFSRVREVMADALAARLYGGSTFGDALLRTALDDHFFGDVVQPGLVNLMRQEGKAVASLTATIDDFYRQFDEAELSRARESLAASAGPKSAFDSHPAVAVRVAYLGRFPDKPDSDPRPVGELIGGWEEADGQVTKMYNARMYAYVQTLPTPARARSAEGA